MGEYVTCTIITGQPNELVAQIHPRMPVILPEQRHAAWLDETDNENLKALLLPYPADRMRMWEISPRVNSPKNDDALLWEPHSFRANTDNNRCQAIWLPLRSDQIESPAPCASLLF
jgi:putative SOS response-associated peptidase YedK